MILEQFENFIVYFQMSISRLLALYLKRIFPAIISIISLSAFVCGQQIGPGIGADTRDARQVIRSAAQAVRKIRNVSYKASYQGTGAFSTHTQTVTGDVAMERLNPGNPFKAKFAARGEFIQTGSDDLQNFHTTFDGVIISRLRPKERALMQKKLQDNDPAERSLGFVTSFFGGGPYQSIMFEWIADEPLTAQSQAAIADYEGRTIVDNVLCHVVYVEYTRQARPVRERWYFGIKDDLPRKFEELAVDAKERHGAYVLTLSGLRVNNTFDNSMFKIAVPNGYAVKSYEPPTPPALLPVGSPAPDCKLVDSQNREHLLSEYRGKVIVLDFWATWCGPCIKAMPGLQKLHDKYKTRGVKVFGVNVWEESNAAAYMEQRKFKYGLLLNGEDVAKTYQVSSLPTLYIIGGDGEIIYRTAITNEEEGETVLEQYLEKLETKSKS